MGKSSFYSLTGGNPTDLASFASALATFYAAFLGSKAAEPTLDNDGNALVEGALYWNSTSADLWVYDGAAWQVINSFTPADYLQVANNLSDLDNAATARSNLALVIGTNVQAWSAILDATTASFLAADRTKLDGIEDAATADQTGAEIKVAYEAEADTNAFDDAAVSKLAGIEASANNYSHPNHTGDVTSTGDGATVIADSAVTLAKMADMATASLIGRATAATGVPEVLSASAARTLLSLVPGTDVQAYDADLAAVAALSTTGIMARTAAATYTMRTITGGANITVTNGDGVSGAPDVALDADLTGISTINSGPLAGFRNALINGDFKIWQRGTSFSATGITADRWRVIFNGTSTGTLTRQEVSPGGLASADNESKYYARLSITTQDAQVSFDQKIEDVRLFQDETVTVSFLVHANTDITGISSQINQNFGSGGSPSSEVGASANEGTFSASTTWTRITRTYTLPSISGKTMGTNGDDCLILYLALIPSGEAGNYIEFADVQMEHGSTRTIFERRPFETELALCQRYLPCFDFDTADKATGFGGQAYTTTNALIHLPFPTTARVSPTGVTMSTASDFANTQAGSGRTNMSGVSLAAATKHGATLITTLGSAVLTAGDATSLYTGSSIGTPKIYFTGAEL